jgi:hypothetical protein
MVNGTILAGATCHGRLYLGRPLEQAHNADITCTILYAVYVRTKLTGVVRLIDAGESVKGILKVLESGVALNGEWYHTSGRHLPW